MQTNSNLIHKSVFYLMLFGLVFSLGTAAADAAAKNHWVTFTLHDEKTGASINGMNYTLTGPGGYKKSGVLSGSAKLGPLAPGRYFVSFKKSGYVPFNSHLTVESNRTYNLPMRKHGDFKAVALPKNYLTILPLPGKGYADFTGATIVLNGPTGRLTEKVKKGEGAVTFYNLKPGRYTYSISFGAYNTANGSVTMASNSRHTQKVNMNAKPVTVTVKVRVEGGKAAGGAMVTASGPTMVRGTTDSSGTVRLNLGPGTWTIMAHQSGFNQQSIQNIKLPGKSSFNLTLTHPRGNARIIVKDNAKYQRLNTAVVNLSGPKGKFTARVDRNGVAHFKKIPQSTYKCTITAPGYNNSSNNIRLNTTATAEYSFMLGKAAPAISGLTVTVLDANTRRPIPNARIVANWVTKGNVYKRRQKRSKTVNTSASGTVNLPIGHKSLVTSIFASASGYHPVRLKSAHVPGKLEMALKPRAAAQRATTGGQKKISANLEVTVLDQKNQRPLPGAIVAMVINGRTYKMPTRPNGIAYFRGLPAGKYSWTASKPGYKNVRRGLKIDKAGTIHQKARLARAN